jgi:FMN-dependent oxidoreductase (nitrilotriacetate monooxygenase family)
LNTTKPSFHLGWFLNGTSVPAWRDPFAGDIGRDWMDAGLFVDLAKAMERARFDFVLVEDNAFIGDRYGDSMEVYLANALQAPRQDPIITATVLALATSRLGIIPTASTFAYHPYLLARMIGTLDQLSKGRSGANIVTGTSDRALQNYGADGMAEHDHRYEEAEDFLLAALALWDTWKPGAIVNDRARAVFADHAKVSRADYSGEFYSTRGPLNSGPLPQGRPVISQAGGSPRGIAFAAKHADVVVAIQPDAERARKYRDTIRASAAEQGRDPDDIKVMFALWPLIGSSDEDAKAQATARDAFASDHIEIQLATLSKSTDIDFAAMPKDVPIGELGLATNGSQLYIDFSKRNGNRTLREVAVMQASGPGPSMVGSIEHVADDMQRFMESSGGDGVLMGTNGVTRRNIAEICDGLVPELQHRGLVRTDYEFEQLRENLRSY